MNAQKTHYDPDKQLLRCSGAWDISELSALKSFIATISWPASGTVTINGSDITKMDSAGAWFLEDLVLQLEQRGLTVTLEDFAQEYESLLYIVEKNIKKENKVHVAEEPSWLARVGKAFIDQGVEIQQYLQFIGLLTYELLRVIFAPKHWRIGLLTNIIYRDGYLGLPIIALLSFMIGVVVAYQMSIQLRNYGADIYVVDFLGILILREFAPLLTAIMVAGRTGSAFTAQLGMMKINQEIDALNIMGVTPAELLLIPRIIALTIALPLLTMWSDIFGIIGGMVMANNSLDIAPYDFLHRFPHVVKLKHFIIGLGKAPVFALIIASIGCFEGMGVQQNAESVGRKTTRSVVLSIFFIIVADAAFSIIFSKLKL